MTEKEQKEIFAKNLNKYINLSKKSQKEICKDLGINTTTFNMWCKGNSMPSVSKIQMLADYFFINKSDLVDEKNDSDIPEYDARTMEMFDLFNRATEPQKEAVLQMLRSFVE